MIKSKGHLTFKDGYEWYLRGGEIYVAPLSNVIDTAGYRIGRWECSIAIARHYTAVYGFLPLN